MATAASKKALRFVDDFLPFVNPNLGKFHNQRKVHNSFLGQTAVFRHRPLCRSLAPRLWFNRPSPWVRSFLTAR